MIKYIVEIRDYTTGKLHHKIFIGNYPEIDNYIDGEKLRPQDTKFRGEGIIVFNKIPKNIKGFLEHSTFPIYILLQDTKRITPELYNNFEVIQDKNTWSMRKFVEHIFYNPDRKYVYEKLMTYKPPPTALWQWIKMNITRIYDTIPEVILMIDEKILMRLPNKFFYAMVSFSLSHTTNIRKLKWTQK